MISKALIIQCSFRWDMDKPRLLELTRVVPVGLSCCCPFVSFMLRKAGIFAKFQQIRMYPMAIFWPVLLWVGEWGSGDFLLANVTPFLPICLKEHFFFCRAQPWYLWSLCAVQIQLACFSQGYDALSGSRRKHGAGASTCEFPPLDPGRALRNWCRLSLDPLYVIAHHASWDEDWND